MVRVVYRKTKGGPDVCVFPIASFNPSLVFARGQRGRERDLKNGGSVGGGGAGGSEKEMRATEELLLKDPDQLVQ